MRRRSRAGDKPGKTRALRALNEALEQRIEEETRERIQIWNVCQDLLVICDLEGKFLKVNPAWTATLGWHESELLGKSSQWMIHPDDRKQALVQTERLAAGRILHRFGIRFREKNGSYRWLSWRAVPHQGRIYAMARDETEQKYAEDRFRQAQQELERVSRQTTLGEMTASIAHEIKQPLAAIVTNGNAGMRWLSRAEPDVKEALTVLQAIVDDGHRASEIVTNIRAMFRKENHEKHLLNANDLVRDVLALVHGEIERQQAVLQVELRDEIPQIKAEQVPLQQVFFNLTMNALEAMTSIKDRDRLLLVKSEIHIPDGVLITVADAGPGIDPKNMDRIFEPFFTTKSEGMGMGLSICRSIVQAHGGRLWVTSSRPHGSAFHVQLPGATE